MPTPSTNKAPNMNAIQPGNRGTAATVTNNLNLNSSAAQYLQNKQQGAATWQAAQNAALAAAQKAAAAKAAPKPTIPAKTAPVKTTTSIGGNGNQAPAGTVFNPNVSVNTSTSSKSTTSGKGTGGSGASTSTSTSTGAGSSGSAAAFKPTGNVANDLATLKANGADSFTITQYMAQYGKGWNWNYLVTSDDKSAMGNAAKILKDAGVTKAYQDANSGKATYYSFDDPNKPGAKVQIPSATYSSATPQQQFALLQKYGVISNTAKLVVNTDGSWGYTDSNASTSNTVNGIPKDLYDQYIQNQALYTKYNKPAPFFVDNTQHAADGTALNVVIPFNNPTQPLIVAQLDNAHYRFSNVTGKPFINQIVNNATHQVVLQSNEGNFSDNQIYTAIASGTLSKKSAITLFGSDSITRILNNPPKAPVVVTSDNFNAFKADPTNGVPSNATFDHFDASTGKLYYNIPASGPLYTDSNGVNRQSYNPYWKPPTAQAQIDAIESKSDGVQLSVSSVLGKNKNYQIINTLIGNAKVNIENLAISVATAEKKITQEGITGVSKNLETTAANLGNNAEKNISAIWKDMVNAAVSYNAAHSGYGTIQLGVKPETFTQEATAIKQAAGDAWKDMVNAAVSYNAAHSGYGTIRPGVKPETLTQEATAIKQAAGDAWKDMVNAAVTYNKNHSGYGTIQPGVKSVQKQTVTKTATQVTQPGTKPGLDLRVTWQSMAATYRAMAPQTHISPNKEGLVGSIIPGSSNEELAGVAITDAASGGSLTPVVVIGILIALGIGALSQQQNIENAINNYREKTGANPTAKQITITGTDGQSTTLYHILQMANTHPTSGVVSVSPSVIEGNPFPTTYTHPYEKNPFPATTSTPLKHYQMPAESMPINQVKVPAIEQVPTHDIHVPSIETMPAHNLQVSSILMATATAGQALSQTTAARRALTPAQLDRLWGNTESNSGLNVGAAYITAENLAELDKAVLDAYSVGALTKEQLEEYNRAKQRYLKAKTKSDTAVGTATQAPAYIDKTIPKSVYIAALSAAAFTMMQMKAKHATKAQMDAAVKQAIYVHTGVQNQTVVKQLTRTAEQISEQTATKAGLQTTTQTALETSTKTAAQQGTKTASQDATQTQTQTKTATQATTATQTAVATNELENENTKENENEPDLEAEAAVPLPNKKKVPGNQKFTDEELANATAHKAGFGWWYEINGRWRFLKRPPPGAQPVKPGKGSGYASVQTINGKPIVDQHRMGAVTVTINRPSKKPGAPGAISYHPSGKGSAGSGRPGLAMTRHGRMVNIKGVGLANAGRMPRGRILRR